MVMIITEKDITMIKKGFMPHLAGYCTLHHYHQWQIHNQCLFKF